MKLTGGANSALRALYDAPNRSGDIVELFKNKGISEPITRAWSAGQELNRFGLLEYYEQARTHADAELNEDVIKLAGGKR